MNQKKGFSSIRLAVLLILCLQNSLFTVVRRYSLGTLHEKYSKYEVLLVGEVIKMVLSATQIPGSFQRVPYLIKTSKKMFLLALLYGAMNVLSLISLRNIGAGLFTIFAQCKILTTATFSTLILSRRYSSAQWRALLSLSLGVVLFSQPLWHDIGTGSDEAKNATLGTSATLIEVTLSGFASIYFEKAIKVDALQLTIWERNFQLAVSSIPVYMAFIVWEGNNGGGPIGSDWTPLAWSVAFLSAMGGLLIALSIKYGDSILKTLATSGAITVTSLLDYQFLDGPLTPTMIIAAGQVIIAICNYTFDSTPKSTSDTPKVEPASSHSRSDDKDEEMALLQADRKE